MSELSTLPQLARPLADTLEQLRAVIASLDDDDYTITPVGPFSSSIGGHVRHCLDHVTRLLSAAEDGATAVLDYDRRERGTSVESDRAAGLAAVVDAVDRLRALGGLPSSRQVAARLMMTSDGSPIEFASSIGREFAFVLSHTIHHHAVIGAMVVLRGQTLPARFGYAPATPTPAGEFAAR